MTVRRTIKGLGSATIGFVLAMAVLVVVANDRRWVLHNMVAHPLLVLCPPLGEWLHDRTAPRGSRIDLPPPAREAGWGSPPLRTCDVPAHWPSGYVGVGVHVPPETFSPCRSHFER